MALFKEDMQREFRFRLADVDNVLNEFENRGMSFFDDTMRIARVVDLLNKSKMKADFERTVVADLPARIEKRVTEIIDWLVSSELRQWQAVTEHLALRRQQHADRIVGQVGRGFDFDRTRLLDSVGRAAQRSVETYDREREGNRLADSVQVAVASTALDRGGSDRPRRPPHPSRGRPRRRTSPASSPPARSPSSASSSSPTAGPRPRRTCAQKIEAMRGQLMTSLTGQFDREIEGSLRRIDEAIGPYTRFVRAEREHLNAAGEELKAVDAGLVRLRGRVEEL